MNTKRTQSTMKNIIKRFFPLFISLNLIFSQVVYAASQTVFYHHDALGSIVASTDQSGAILWHEEYQPYGEKIDVPEQTLTIENEYWYTGKPYDGDIDLSYFGARWYDAKQGRFLSMDPAPVKAENIHSFNRYVYANNNPYKYVDPDGEFAFVVFLLAASFGALTTLDTINSYDSTASVVDDKIAGYSINGLQAAGTTAAIDVAIEAAVGAGALGVKLLGRGVANSGTTTVGRWMSKAEHEAMLKTGKVQESYSGTTHVANPAQAEAFLKQAAPGSRYVEFDVPTSLLKQTSGDWAKIVGPNSLEGRLAAKKGLEIPQMPSATNIIHKADKLP